MATIADRIIRADGTALNAGTVYFIPTATVVTGSAGVSSAAVSAVTNASGEFTVTLTPGVYRVRWRWSTATIPDEIPVTVPAGSGTYTLDDLTDFVPTPSGVIQWTSIAGRDSLAAIEDRISNQMAFLSFLSSEGDGQGGWFEFSTASTADHDGVDVIIPNDLDSGDSGRWIRKVYT